MTDEIEKILNSLAERFCERRALNCLHRFLPAIFSLNGLTDGWYCCRDHLNSTRSLCKDDLETGELDDLNKVINLIDRMLAPHSFW